MYTHIIYIYTYVYSAIGMCTYIVCVCVLCVCAMERTRIPWVSTGLRVRSICLSEPKGDTQFFPSHISKTKTKREMEFFFIKLWSSLKLRGYILRKMFNREKTQIQ